MRKGEKKGLSEMSFSLASVEICAMHARIDDNSTRKWKENCSIVHWTFHLCGWMRKWEMRMRRFWEQNVMFYHLLKHYFAFGEGLSSLSWISLQKAIVPNGTWRWEKICWGSRKALKMFETISFNRFSNCLNTFVRMQKSSVPRNLSKRIILKLFDQKILRMGEIGDGELWKVQTKVLKNSA